jgi:HD-GYP domain-containing protein (c-di-GMP phosphodiesterase class II)
MFCVDFAVSGVLFAPFYQGYRVWPLIHSEFLDLAPAVMVILTVAVGAAALTPAWGIFALMPLAVVILLPQFALAALARSRSVARLEPAEATAVYASALADQLGLSRFERRLVNAAARPVRSGLAPWHWARPPAADPPLTALVVLGVDERWDGTGRPFAIPAACTARLSHTEAMLDLAARAGRQFDPEVVEAAAEIVAAEATFTRSADFEPRLHHWPLPAALRHRGFPALAALR